MPPRGRLAGPASQPAPQTASPSIAESLLHSLQPWPVEVSVQGFLLRFPAMSAAEWIAAIMDEDLVTEMIDLLGEEESFRILSAWATGDIDAEELSDALLDVITVCSGRPWWVTLRLLHAAAGAWDTIGGAMALKGVNAARMPLQAYMDALLATVLMHTEPKDHASFLTRLKVPVGSKVAPIDDKREADAFMAYMRSS